MGKNTLTVSNLYYRYEDNPLSLFDDLSFTSGTGWTGIVGANGAGKSTLLKLIARELYPGSGTISGPEIRILCEQRTDMPPRGTEDFFEALYEGGGRAGALFGKLGLEYDWPHRWNLLSFGERKRMQLAAALFLEPDILLLDEPTNHLDESAVALVLSILQEYRGIGLVVSHDRRFLNTLCSANLFLEGGAGVLRPGTLDDGMARQAEEELNSRREYETQRKRVSRLKQESRRRKNEAERHSRDFSKKSLSWKDSDTRGKIDGLRLTGKDVLGGKLAKKIDARLQRETEVLSKMRLKGLRKEGVTFHGESGMRRDFLFRLEAGRLPLGDRRAVEIPELVMALGERIALTGTNGSGKTTLIRKILSSLNIPPGDLLHLPQELSTRETADLYGTFSRRTDEERGAVLSHFYRLNGDPEALMDSSLPSPGEARKLMVAMGLEREVALIILDEPTNHLDLPSLKAMEEALKRCGTGLLLVSHDPVFREQLTEKEWRIGSNGQLAIFL